jgi:hypothetical protein
VKGDNQTGSRQVKDESNINSMHLYTQKILIEFIVIKLSVAFHLTAVTMSA